MPKEINKKQAKEKSNKNKTHFMKDFKSELKRVIWPTPKQLFNNTVTVIVIVLITALIVFVLDLAFENLNKYGIEKLKNVVDTTETTGNEISNMIDIDSNTEQNTQVNQAVKNAESN